LDFVETVQVEEYVDNFSPVVQSLLDEAFKVLLGYNAARDDFVVRDPSEETFNFAGGVVYRGRYGLRRAVGFDFVKEGSVRTGLVNLPDHAVFALANCEFEPDLCLAGSVADDLLVAGLLVRKDHSTVQSIQNRV